MQKAQSLRVMIRSASMIPSSAAEDVLVQSSLVEDSKEFKSVTNLCLMDVK